jgi:hypothetical protein
MPKEELKYFPSNELNLSMQTRYKRKRKYIHLNFYFNKLLLKNTFNSFGHV